MTQTIEAPQTTRTNRAEDEAHMIDCPADQPSTQVWLTKARVEGLTVTAICGYQFIPERDPKKFRVCEACTTEAGNRIFEGV